MRAVDVQVAEWTAQYIDRAARQQQQTADAFGERMRPWACPMA
jgi:hypothetical protein